MVMCKTITGIHQVGIKFKYQNPMLIIYPLASFKSLFRIVEYTYLCWRFTEIIQYWIIRVDFSNFVKAERINDTSDWH